MVVPLATLTTEALSGAIRNVLTNHSYRAAAERAADSIRSLKPAEEAVRLIEEVLSGRM
jgi:UDP:flavonoid glycosyltransferase YjiC (YdhE family)